MGACLVGVGLNGANLARAFFYETNLTSSLGLTQEQIDSGITDKDTIVLNYLQQE